MNGLAKHLPTQRLSSLTLTLLGVALAMPAHAAEGGLVLVPDLRMLIGLIVCFAILVFPLNALLFKPILKALEEREARIAGTRAKAERLAADTQAVLERYETAIRLAREESEQERRTQLDRARARMLETTGEARGTAERQLDRARSELNTTVEEARFALRAHANELAREAAASVLGRPV